MVLTYTHKNKIYSVDMMISYVNCFQHPVIEIPLTQLEHTLINKCWTNIDTKICHSPNDVLENPEKYKKDMERIKSANLSFPIIVNNNYIIDGFHRYTKAYLGHEKTIKACVFDKKLMQKFVLDKKGNCDKVDNMKAYKLIDLFYKRFLLEDGK